MKKRIGTIKGIPVIEGDPNEISKNEMHYAEGDGTITLSKRDINNELKPVTNTESSEGVKYYYYKYVHSENAWEMFTLLCSSFYIEYLKKVSDGNTYIIDHPGEPDDLVGFKLVGVPQISTYERYSDSSSTFVYVQLDGDIFSRIAKLASTLNEEMTEDQIREALKANFIEISKEEYDTLYTKLDII